MNVIFRNHHFKKENFTFRHGLDINQLFFCRDNIIFEFFDKYMYDDVQTHLELVSKKESLFGSHQINYSMYIACYTGIGTKQQEGIITSIRFFTLLL